MGKRRPKDHRPLSKVSIVDTTPTASSTSASISAAVSAPPPVPVPPLPPAAVQEDDSDSDTGPRVRPEFQKILDDMDDDLLLLEDMAEAAAKEGIGSSRSKDSLPDPKVAEVLHNIAELQELLNRSSDSNESDEPGIEERHVGGVE